MQQQQKKRRESQYIDEYLDCAAQHRWTTGTFLAYTLSGRAKHETNSYQRSLERAIMRRIASGEVVPIRSARGGVAYVRTADLHPSDVIVEIPSYFLR